MVFILGVTVLKSSIYSSVVLPEVLVLKYFHLTLLLHYKSETNILHLTLHLFDNFGYLADLDYKCKI